MASALPGVLTETDYTFFLYLLGGGSRFLPLPLSYFSTSFLLSCRLLYTSVYPLHFMLLSTISLFSLSRVFSSLFPPCAITPFSSFTYCLRVFLLPLFFHYVSSIHLSTLPSLFPLSCFLLLHLPSSTLTCPPSFPSFLHLLASVFFPPPVCVLFSFILPRFFFQVLTFQLSSSTRLFHSSILPALIPRRSMILSAHLPVFFSDR